jgi:EAL domain-containing protein (putative c-di-GMP-specific phosphodiesterase class I)
MNSCCFISPWWGRGTAFWAWEALVRWEHPELGLVPPSKFITVAEETGAIEPLGRWVLDTACRWAIRLHQNGYQYLFVTVNLSPRQFKDPDLLDSVVKTLNETGLPPTALKLEITESCVMDDPEEAIEKMKALRDMGIGFSIDDFGTGYSSLSYLKRFPIDTLKIDRSFVMESLTNRDDQEIIRTIISMAQNLRIQTVAEGVESKEQRDFLLSLGCSIMQGYYFGRPMPDRDFEKLLSNHSSTR